MHRGCKNLALGLKDRHYIPASLGQVNQFEVADKPVWIEVGIVSITFLFFGTHEETYLAIYAAGVFILLTMTGAAVTNRLVRNVRETFNWSTAALIVGTIFATILTAAATFIIFFERFADGAWTYLLFIPILYAAFSYFRKRFGPPTIEKDAAGQFNAAQLAGFGFGQYPSADPAATNGAQELEITWQPEPIEKSQWRDISVDVKHLIILLDGSDYAAQALPLGRRIGQATGAKITLLSSIKNHTSALQGQFDATQAERVHYLTTTAAELTEAGCDVAIATRPGQLADATAEFVSENSVDLIVTSTRGKSGAMHWSTGGVTTKLLNAVSIPLLLVQTADQVRPVNGEVSEVKRILVALDGSIPSEEILPYARALVKAFEAELVLLAVPEMPTMDQYRAPSEAIELLRTNAEANMSKFLGAVARSLRESDINVKTLVTGSLPARTIVSAAKEQQADLIMLTSRGRGGLDLLYSGSVAQRVVENTDRPVFMMPVRRPDAE